MNKMNEEIKRLSTKSQLQERIQWLFQQCSDRLSELEDGVYGKDNAKIEKLINEEIIESELKVEVENAPVDEHALKQIPKDIHTENAKQIFEQSPIILDEAPPGKEPKIIQETRKDVNDMLDFLEKKG